MTTINIRVLRHSAFYTPLLLTIKAGFLAQQGLQAQYDIATRENPIEGALMSGEIHLAQSAVATSFAMAERGEDNGLRHFAQINDRDGFFIIQRNAGKSFDWHDLIGHQVLVDHFFQPLAMFRYALHRLNIDYSSLDVIDAGDVDSMDHAYRTGRGQFVHQQGPYAQQLEHDGLGKVIAAVGDVIGPVAFSSLLASSDWLATEMAGAFIHAYCQGQQAALAMPADEIARVLADFFPRIDRAVLEATIASYQRLGCWTTEPGIPRASYEKALDVFEFSGLISRRFAYEQIVSSPLSNFQAG